MKKSIFSATILAASAALVGCGGGGSATDSAGNVYTCKATSLSSATCNGEKVSLADVSSVKDNKDGTFTVVLKGQTFTVKPDNYASDLVLDVFTAHSNGITGTNVDIVIADGFSHSSAKMGNTYHGDIVLGITSTIAKNSDIYELDLGDLSKSTTYIANDINKYAGTNDEADIYNMSFGSYYSDVDTSLGNNLGFYTDSYKGAISNSNAAFVIAAGNDAQGDQKDSNGIAKDCSQYNECNSYAVEFVNNGNADQLVVVGALNHEGTKLESYSTQAGLLKEYYITTVVASEYEGTSFAAPVVSGAIALVMDKYNNVDGANAIAIIFKTADDLGAKGVDDVYGNGRLNVSSALSPVGNVK